MALNQKSRDYLFDNYKALLIFLVVIGHFIDPCYENNSLLLTVKWLIFSFHMPAFILISGYFSRHQASLGKLIQKLLVPYLAFEAIYYLVYTFLIQKKTELYLLYPKFSLWYLLALFVWKFITPYVKKIPHYMFFSIVVGLAAGFLTISDNFLSIPRILFFYPYFLAGSSLDRSLIRSLHKRPYQIAGAFGVLCFILYLFLDSGHKLLSVKIFYGRYNYDSLGLAPLEGILIRLLCYGIGFAFTFVFALLIPEHRTVFSSLGTSTMAIYLFHGLIYNFIKEQSSVLENITSISDTFILLVFCTALTLLLSWKPLTRLTSLFSSLSLSSLGHEANRVMYYNPAYKTYVRSL